MSAAFQIERWTPSQFLEPVAGELNHAPRAVDREYAHASALLSRTELDPALADEILFNARRQRTPDSDWLALLQLGIESRLAVDASLGRLSVFVGNPGVGKTTAVLKLAIQRGLVAGKSVQILSVDTRRAAGSEQLRSYAAKLGIEFTTANNRAELAQALQQNLQRDLILIDTPGFGRHDSEPAGDLARILSAYPDRDTHLVLSACMKSADLKRTAAAFAPFQPTKLLFTNLDETDTFGPILNCSVQTGTPVSFLTFGQDIPEDLRAARTGSLARLILNGRGA